MPIIGQNADTLNINRYEIDGFEYATNVENVKAVPPVIKLYIPKYMPNVSKGLWTKPFSISQESLEVNDNECKVTLPKVVNEQGYITVYPYPNEHPDFTDKTQMIKGRRMVPKDNWFLVQVLYGDPNEIRFVGKV